MAILGRYALLMACLVCLGDSRSIRDEIEQHLELTELESYMERLDIWSTLGDIDLDYTFFAPIDGAFRQIPNAVRNDLQSTSPLSEDRVNDMFLNHAVLGEVLTTTLTGTETASRVINSLNLGGKLFLRNMAGVKFVNGARFNYTNIRCDNGVLHIIDTFLHGTLYTDPAISVIEELSQATDSKKSARHFNTLLAAYASTPTGAAYYDISGGVQDRYVTMFIPTDEYFNELITANANFLNNLLNDQAELHRVIESHIITGDTSAVYHSGVLIHEANRDERLDAAHGTVIPKYFNNDLYVSNNCAQGKIVVANTTVNNGVIHMIDGLMGYLFYDIEELLYYDPEFSDLETYALMSSSYIQSILRATTSGSAPVPDTEKYTLFAPVDAAFDDIQRINNEIDFSQDEAQVDTLFKLHLIHGEIKQSSMLNNTEYNTLEDGVSARFYQYQDGTTWVEVDHVRGRVIRSDYCVRNGIVHFVDHVLGVALQTIYEAIASHDELRQLYAAVQRTGFRTYLDDHNKQLTFFAPTDSAFEAMREGEVGRSFLDDVDLLQGLIERHFVTREFYLDTIDSSIEVRTHAGQDIEIRRDHNDYYILYEGRRINIIMRDQKMINGVLNIIESVIYVESPRDLEVIGAAGHALGSIALLLMCLLMNWSH